MMVFHFILLIASLMTFLRGLHASSCSDKCDDKLVFTPSSLIVKYGDPATVNCSVYQKCNGTSFGLETYLGVVVKNGTMLSWTVDSMTEWGAYAMCYYNDDVTGDQCHTNLPVTIYQPPDNVSISFVDHAGPMIEGHQYTLQCTVQNVAPVENLIVTFYRGQTALGQPQSKSNTSKKPVTETFTLDITPTKEDDGVQYWCEAKLELGPEGPQPPPVVISQNITAAIHYENCDDEPVFTPSSLIVKYGEPASVRCSVCQKCRSTSFGLEIYFGVVVENGTMLSWTVDSMTEWDAQAMCYYNDDVTGDQCYTVLPVTIYQPPDKVSISFVDHAGPMIEGHQYTLQCTVQNVAPVENLIVTFYRGQTALGQPQSKSNTNEKPVTETFTLDITPTKEDEGVQYWCEAKLELGPEGPQPPPVVISQNITAAIHYPMAIPSGHNPHADVYWPLLITVAAVAVLVIIITIFLLKIFRSL